MAEAAWGDLAGRASEAQADREVNPKIRWPHKKIIKTTSIIRGMSSSFPQIRTRKRLFRMSIQFWIIPG
jgi:hypothetical protein